MKRTQLYKSAVDNFGETAQIHMALEEMSELSKELLKDLRNKKRNPLDVASEVADVEITLEQIKRIYEIDIPVRAIKRVKKKRLQKIIDSMKPLTVEQVIAKVQKHFKKRLIGDAIALEICCGLDELYFEDCKENEYGEHCLENLYKEEVENYEINKDYYDDESGKYCLYIELKAK